MKGILSDDFEDPRTQGILALGLGLLGARGNFGQALSQAGGQALGAYQGGLQMKSAKEMANLQKAALISQMVDREAQTNLRRVEAERKAAALKMLQGMQGGGMDFGGASDGTDGGAGGAGMPSFPAAGGQRGPAFNGVPPQAIAMDLALNDGKNVGEWLFKRGTPNWEATNGYVWDKNNGQPGFLPSATTTPDGRSIVSVPGRDGIPNVSVAPGALKAYQAFKNIDAGIAAGNDLVEVTDPSTGRTVMVTRAQAVQAANGGRQPQQQSMPPSAAPRQPGARVGPDMPRNSRNPAGYNQGIDAGSEPERIRILQAELSAAQAAGRTQDAMAVTRELSALGVRPGAGPMIKSISPQEKARISVGEETDKTINQNWLKESFNPVVQAGDASGSQLANVQTARLSLAGLGSSGWGTDAKAKAASVLGALGVKDAEQFASNAQMFQNASMKQVDAILRTYTGVQTEGDAQRAGQQFASLANTPRANEFVLDITQATAEKNRIRASFYRDAMAIAQSQGLSLSEIDRRWQNSPANKSIYDMPIMKRWSGK